MSTLSSHQEALEEQGYFFYESVGDVKRYHVNLISWQADASSLSEAIAYAEKHKEARQELKQAQGKLKRMGLIAANQHRTLRMISAALAGIGLRNKDFADESREILAELTEALKLFKEE